MIEKKLERKGAKRFHFTMVTVILMVFVILMVL